MKFYVIAAMDEKHGIAKSGSIPWDIPEDMKYFKHKTITIESASNMQNAVIMGRKTYDVCKGLKNRYNIVISKSNTQTYNPDHTVVSSVQEAYDIVRVRQDIEDVYIIGGQDIYKEILESGIVPVQTLYITMIYDDFDCDRFFPDIPLSYKKTMGKLQTHNGCFYSFDVYTLQKTQLLGDATSTSQTVS